MSRTQVVLLGTGTPNLEPHRYQSSLAVIVDDIPYVIDCGGGTVQRLSQACNHKEIAALAAPQLTRLFLTHLHPDHTTGLPDFIIGLWLERHAPLHIWGPKGTQALVDHILTGYEPGIAEHRDGLAPINHPLTVEVTEITPGQVYADERVTLTAFRASHGGLEAYSYKFVTPDRTIVISGDTCPTDDLVAQAQGCDILIHECYSAVKFAVRTADWQRYHRTVHTSTSQLAAIANQVQPGVLVLVHQLFWGASEEELVEEIREDYDGNLVCGHDLDVIV